MDIATQLALMAKAKNVFGTDQTFLSFPVTLLPFTKQQLNFLADFNISNLQTFSLLVNQIPTGEAWLPTDQHYLWDVYGEILEHGDFATSARTAAEEADYQKARRIFRVEGAEEDTAMYKTYKQYKDAFLLAQQAYLAAKSTAEYSTDAAVKHQWQTVDEPRLRTELANREQLWVIEGYKNEIEDALNTVFALSSKAPITTQQEWKARFNRDIDQLTDAASLLSVYPSSFSPANALEEGSWQPFKLTADEVKALVAQAPEALRNRLSVGTGDSEIDSLSFEFSSATVLRPWLTTDAFKSRFWRFDDAGRVLSNGATPPTGTCPAYVTALVFARNLTVTRRAAAPSSKPSSELKTVPLPDFQFPVMVQAEQFQIVQPLPVEKTSSRPVAKPNLEEITRITVPLNTVDRSTLNKAAFRRVATPLMATNKLQSVRATRAWQLETEDLGGERIPPGRLAGNRRIFRGIEASTFDRIDPAVLQGEASPGSTPPPPPPPEVDPNIYIFAFICKQIPQCPNPDPNLQW